MPCLLIRRGTAMNKFNRRQPPGDGTDPLELRS
jgi:hypothetical protein